MPKEFQLRPLQILGIAAVLTFVLAQNENLDMMGLINILYMKADGNFDGAISLEEMSKVYSNLDKNGDGKIVVSEFSPSWQLITSHSEEMAEAYFFLADIDGNGVLDQKDNADIYARFDLNNDGQVQAKEFVTKWKQVYHEVPYVLLFERVEKANNNDQHLTKQEFSQLFTSFKDQADGSVTKSQFLKQWTDEKFGSQGDAIYAFNLFDVNKDDVISKVEVSNKFDGLDTNGNGKLEILEAIDLAN